MERHFACNACGACCTGSLPLTFSEAREGFQRFPLALVWTPVRQGARNFALASRLGAGVRLRDRRHYAILITPTVYLPPEVPCPERTGAGLCAIHAEKPLRCRTMPFYPWREEEDQAELLIPRKGWTCETSKAAPVAYRNKTIVEAGDFQRERQALEAQASLVQTYFNKVSRYAPQILDNLNQVTARKGNGSLTTGFETCLALMPGWINAATFARAQIPLLAHYEEITRADPVLARWANRYRLFREALSPYAERSS
mgnify:CR=1 FL=1